jgi:hypothetical protein
MFELEFPPRIFLFHIMSVVSSKRNTQTWGFELLICFNYLLQIFQNGANVCECEQENCRNEEYTCFTVAGISSTSRPPFPLKCYNFWSHDPWILIWILFRIRIDLN